MDKTYIQEQNADARADRQSLGNVRKIFTPTKFPKKFELCTSDLQKKTNMTCEPANRMAQGNRNLSLLVRPKLQGRSEICFIRRSKGGGYATFQN